MTVNKTPSIHEDAPTVAVAGDPDKLDLEQPSEQLQRGVQDVEAVTKNWSKAALISVFAK